MQFQIVIAGAKPGADIQALWRRTLQAGQWRAVWAAGCSLLTAVPPVVTAGSALPDSGLGLRHPAVVVACCLGQESLRHPGERQ